MVTPAAGRLRESGQRPLMTPIDETLAQALRASGRSSVAWREFAGFDLERVRDGYLPEKPEHPEAFLP